MTTSNTEQEKAAPAMAAKEREPAKKARVAERKLRVAAPKAKSNQKARQQRKGAKSRNKAIGTRPGSKTAKILDLLKRPGGATLTEIMKATNWQAHSVRGFLSGTLRKKMRLTVTSTKGENGERSYRLKA